MKTLKTIFISLAIIIMSFSFVSFAFAADGEGGSSMATDDPTAAAAAAAATETADMNDYLNSLKVENIPIEKTSLTEIIGNVIKVILGLSGLVALVFVIWGGVQIAVSQGDEKAIKAAKDRMISGAIGIIIISSAYAISDFIIKAIGRI